MARLQLALRVGVVAVATALALTACSSTETPSASTSSGAGGSSTSAAGGSASSESATSGSASGGASTADASAADKVAEYSSADQTFPVPTATFTPGQHTATVIAFGSAAPVVQVNAEAAAEALTTMGWTVNGPLDGEFAPSTIGGQLDSAVQQKVDAVVMTSVNVEDSGEAIKNALNAGIAISCIMCPVNQEFKDLGVMYATIDFEAQGEILGWYLTDASAGAGKIVNTVDPGSRATVKRAAGVRSIVEQNCSGCTMLDDLVIPSADIAQPGPPQWSAFLSANPSGEVTDAVGMADVLGVPMAKALTDIGRADVNIVGYDADPQALDLIKAGPPYIGTVALPYHWADWAGADLVARQVAGVETWDASELPMQLVTPDNVGSFTEFVPQGDWKGAFETLWGVN